MIAIADGKKTLEEVRENTKRRTDETRERQQEGPLRSGRANPRKQRRTQPK